MPNLEPFTAKLEPFTADPNECLRVAMPDSTGTSELKLLDNVAICCSIVIVAPSEPDPMPGAMEQQDVGLRSTRLDSQNMSTRLLQSATAVGA